MGSYCKREGRHKSMLMNKRRGTGVSLVGKTQDASHGDAPNYGMRADKRVGVEATASTTDARTRLHELGRR